MPATRPFLTSEWRWLVMLNFEVPPALLLPHVPVGTELDTYEGRTFLSVVGFHYFNTRLLGWRVPGHVNFAEVNLRFYVRRVLDDGSVRRAVVFIKELVPRWAIAAVARWCYREPFVSLPVRGMLDPPDDAPQSRGTAAYEWRHRGRWNRLAVEATGPARPLVAGSEAEFIAEHYWAYTRYDARTTNEYEVTHPRWRTFDVSSHVYDCDVATLYGLKYVPFLRGEPSSVFLAEGSPVEVWPGSRLTGNKQPNHQSSGEHDPTELVATRRSF